MYHTWYPVCVYVVEYDIYSCTIFLLQCASISLTFMYFAAILTSHHTDWFTKDLSAVWNALVSITFIFYDKGIIVIRHKRLTLVVKGIQLAIWLYQPLFLKNLSEMYFNYLLSLFFPSIFIRGLFVPDKYLVLYGIEGPKCRDENKDIHSD